MTQGHDGDDAEAGAGANANPSSDPAAARAVEGIDDALRAVAELRGAIERMQEQVARLGEAGGGEARAQLDALGERRRRAPRWWHRLWRRSPPR